MFWHSLRQKFFCLLLSSLLFLAFVPPAYALPQEKTVGKIESVASFNGAMPTGVTVSQRGRIFVNFPRWGDKVDYTVAEIVRGKAVAYPNAKFNRPQKDQSKSLVSVQSVVVDPLDRLWILDTGSIQFAPTAYGGPKLIGINLKQNRIFKTILFPQDVALPTTYLNDIRFDLRRGKAGMAFITDSSGNGANAIIVVDLDSGKSWRRLNDHPSTKAEPNFLPVVEGQPLMNRPPDKPPSPITIGADGIAISADGRQLFYCTLAGRRLYSVSVDALVDEKLSDKEVAVTVKDLGDKGGASDGLESDAQNRVYLTNYEHNAILQRSPDGMYETVVHDPRVLWADTLSVANDGYLYFIANQLHRQPQFHQKKDLREKPYSLFRTRINAKPVLLR
ncbi:SMP-30/gluconolactonase/LRE family protein [Chroococcidiopsis sp. FACHB-1243]|uniref:L-dopachrome tautomerase-related protein n=1 Tax=Chroococcidiopsis sp. [FACHB-1243] TaxID=2692781 RepID=UPI00177FD724|nr:L-dopachrome tautomerase-related protein [Chroococcidiopsis sp. [FACHB-1243]]MBD2304563.1 SMP-30/gluconolactonase/LRE family protein [Chroococcidiopsis sp. [FACHB-1243]]